MDPDSLTGKVGGRQLFPGLPLEDWPSDLESSGRCFPRTERYTAVDRSVIWEADLDMEQGTILLMGRVVDVAGEQRSELHDLVERVRRHDRLMGNLPGMVYRCRQDTNWTMEFVSQGVENLAELTPEHLLSGEVAWGEDVIIEEDQQRTWEVVTKALAKREPFTLQYKIHAGSGEIRTVWERGVGIFDSHGNIIALEGFIINVTPLVQAQEELLDANVKLNNLLNAATETSVIMTGTDGVITSFNSGAENMLGYRAAEVIGRYTPLIIHREEEVEKRARDLSFEFGQEIAGIEVFFALARRGQRDRQRWTYVRKDGTTLTVELITTTVRDHDDNIIGFLGVAEDVTEQIQVQQALCEAKERAEASNRAKDEFLAVISHEMRTPLNPILGFSNMLLQECEDAETRESLEIIERSAHKLLRQIEDILDFIGIDKQKTKVNERPTVLWAYAQTLARDLESLRNGNEFEVVNGCAGEAMEVSLAVMLDQELTSQIISNLVINAFKFTLHGKVSLCIGWRDEGGGRLRIEVVDNGIGIAGDKHEEVFRPFTQVESTYTRRFDGVGLGLAICSKLVDVLGGEIGFESELGHGSTFWFELPALFVSSASVENSIEEIEANQFTQMRVLVVEDNLDNRRLLVGLLQKIGADVMTAPDGASAVDRCRIHDFHVVLMDISMPEMDGFEATRRIQALSNCEPRVVAVTAHASEEVKLKCQDCGMVDFVSKPVSLNTLRNVLESHQGVLD